MGRSSRSAPARRSAPPPPARPSASFSSSARAPPPPTARAPPPAPAPAPAPAPMVPQQQSGGMLSGIGSTIMQGMALGVGSSLGRRAVDAVMGDGSSSAPAPAPAAPPVYQENPAPRNACSLDFDAFNQCMKMNSNRISDCDSYYQALQNCQSQM